MPLGRYDEAEQAILRGIDLAQKAGLPLLAARGCRHLGGLEIQRRRPEQAVAWLDRALQAAEAVADPDRRRALIAGANFGKAEALLLLDRPDEALAASRRARQLFLAGKDPARAVKTHAQVGKALEQKGRLSQAAREYRLGLCAAEEAGRKEEIVRNRLGLARVALAEKDPAAAGEHLAAAQTVLARTSLEFEVDHLDDQLAEIKSRLGK